MDKENNFASMEIIDEVAMKNFQDGIENLKNREDVLRQAEGGTAHFEGEFDKTKLTEEDRKMWELKEELLMGQINPETARSRFEIYQNELAQTKNADPSRIKFGAFLGNELTKILAKQELAKRRGKK